MQEKYQVNLKECPLKYFWLLLILNLPSANCFKWYFPPPNADKLENAFPLFLLFWQVCNILSKTTNNLGAILYTYMNSNLNEPKAAPLWKQSSRPLHQ